MVPIKRLDNVVVFTSLMLDVSLTLGQEFYTPRSLRLDTQKVENRIRTEGLSFIVKTLPRLGKALDRALSGDVPLDSTGFRKEPGSQIPKLFGDLFKRIFTLDGWVLQTPCTNSVRMLRQLLNVYYKYEVPYSPQLEQKVLDQFVKTEQDLLNHAACRLCNFKLQNREFSNLLYKARARLKVLLSDFVVRNVLPRHGPGAVSTRETGPGKFTFGRYNERIASIYPWDEYFYSSLGHVCDDYRGFSAATVTEPNAKVILVPKDSRGPRLISCEPLEFQWIQQGLGEALKYHIEHHPLTMSQIHFKDQEPNRNAALLGSVTGNTCTLDLKEASDRVSVGLVQHLFPEHVKTALLATRTLATTMPDGSVLTLRKFAPMGSALCFPILALTIWAVLSAGLDAKARKGLLVYGDDVIVPRANARDAIAVLESVGLKVNMDKSCINGLFQESCGKDAFMGVCVTPVRFRTVWSSTPSAGVYTSWLAYANSMYKHGYINCAYKIADYLLAVYKSIPMDETDSGLYPALVFYHPDNQEPLQRTNRNLQKREQKVRVVVPKTYDKVINGWSMLLRYFTEGKRASSTPIYNPYESQQMPYRSSQCDPVEPFCVSVYTQRGREQLRFRWR
jgi:hypothetical protein